MRMMIVGCAAAFLLLGGGCKSKLEKACDHLLELAAKQGERDSAEKREQERKECVEEMGKCSNSDEVAECYLNLQSTDMERQCRRLCKR
jgi:hypothetical protein